MNDYIDLEIVGDGKFTSTYIQEVGTGRRLRARHISVKMGSGKSSPRVYCELGGVKLDMKEEECSSK